METDWQEVSRIAFPPPAPHAQATPVTIFAFDTSQELIWTGNDYGRVTSFHNGPSGLSRYTSYRAHAAKEGAVKQILVCDKGVLSVASKSVHFASRRGLAQWHLTHDDFRDLRCMCFLSKGASEILVGGCQSTIFKIDVEKGEIVETLPAAEQYTLMKRGGQYICAATSSGSVQLLNAKTFVVLKSWKAHMGWINDMDANSSFLVTCGWSPRQQFGNMLDPLAKVFDLKTLMPLPPVSFHAGAAFVRMHPRMMTTCIIASQSGQLQLVDIMNSTMVTVRQVNLVDSYLLLLDIAPSGEALALADTNCTIQLCGSLARMTFTGYSNQTEFPDQVPKPPSVGWRGNEPLSSIGMPYYRETLLSSWPSHMIFDVGGPPPKIDPIIINNMTRTDFGGYAPNPRKTRRNQAEDTRATEKALAALEGPKFLSEKAKDGASEDGGRRMSDILDQLSNSSLDGALKVDVPVMYRNVEIKYSKFGVEDFDFEYYNKTKYSGLETHIANSYANPLLQLLRFTPWIRNLALHHTATSCLFETCLLCELGFLFDMLEKANGQNCQATNFLKTFSGLSHSASLGLLEESSPARPLTLMIQSTARFLLEKLAADFRQMSPHVSHMDQALTTVAMNSIRCAHCANETVRPGGTYIHELVYPQRSTPKSHTRMHGPTFSQIFKASVERQDQTRGWCDRCKRYQQLSTRKTIQSISPVLVLNAAVHSADAKQLWAKPRWLPQEIGIVVDQGQFYCYEGQDLNFHLRRGAFNIVVYELVGVVADISAGESQKSHLVSLINVAISTREKQSENQWHLFNDFLVRKAPDEEALRFDPTWKLPSVLTYQVKSARHRIDDTWKDNLDTTLLYRKWSLQQDDDPAHFQTLAYPAEKPAPGARVGIDAEFVALQQEELEIKADGSRSVVRPSRLGLARVSVLRGGMDITSSESFEDNSDSEEQATHDPYIPFIDDYIHIQEPIIDYLTLYSGISPGDLNPKTSPYASTGRLVSLKTAYKKIWLLLNLGVVFVGHGLLKDFRTINIHIPKAQVVDTVDLYYLKSRGRKLSLRFLSWLILDEMVQTANHDSVEDARTAIRLWREWQKFEREERCEEVLQEIYKRGRDYNFRVPASAMEGSRLVNEGQVGERSTSTHTGHGSSSIADSETSESSPGTPKGRAAGLVPAKLVGEAELR